MCKIVVPIRSSAFVRNNVSKNTSFRGNGLWHMRTMGKPMITIFLGGTDAEQAEHWPQQELRAFVVDQLTSAKGYKFSAADIAGPIQNTDWCSNPFTLGAYSAATPGAVRKDPVVLGNVILAGEAFVESYSKWPSMMSGAYTSGTIAATRI
jgi:monoamine oxidase